MPHRERVLVVDDDNDIRQICREALEGLGCEVHEAADGMKAEALLDSLSFALVLSDIMMPGSGGMDLLRFISSRHPDTMTVLFTGYASVDLARESMKLGAFDFITKPFRVPELLATSARAFEARRRLTSELRAELSELLELTQSSDIESESHSSFMDRFCRALIRGFRAEAAAVFPAPGRDAAVSEPMHQCGDEDVIAETDWMSLIPGIAGSGDGLLLVSDETGAGASPGAAVNAMGLLLHGKEDPLGLVIVARASTSNPFTPRDLKLLGLFNAHAANQLTNYGLTDKLKSAAAALEEVSVISGSFTSSLDTDVVLDSVVRGIRSFLPFDVFAAFISVQGSPPLSYMLHRNGIDPGYIRGALTGMASPALGHEAFLESWEDARVETFDVRSDGEPDPTLHWRSFPVGDQARLRGLLLAGFSQPLADEMKAMRYLPLLAGQAASALGNAYLHQTGESNYFQTISALAQAVDAKDPYTHDHSRNVTIYSLALADYLSLPEREREDLKNAALLHDIGKIGIPEAILNKPSSLTESEFEVIRSHPHIGWRILSPVGAMAGIAQTVRHHHERFDGKGYPLRLSGEGIPFHARLLAVADTFDAMISDRVYRPSPGMDYALSELRRSAGSQLDPSIVFAFLEILSGMSPDQIRTDYSQEIP